METITRVAILAKMDVENEILCLPLQRWNNCIECIPGVSLYGCALKLGLLLLTCIVGSFVVCGLMCFGELTCPEFSKKALAKINRPSDKDEIEQFIRVGCLLVKDAGQQSHLNAAQHVVQLMMEWKISKGEAEAVDAERLEDCMKTAHLKLQTYAVQAVHANMMERGEPASGGRVYVTDQPLPTTSMQTPPLALPMQHQGYITSSQPAIIPTTVPTQATHMQLAPPLSFVPAAALAVAPLSFVPAAAPAVVAAPPPSQPFLLPVQLPPGWISQIDPATGAPFFVHTPTAHTQWQRPS